MGRCGLGGSSVEDGYPRADAEGWDGGYIGV